MITNKMLNTNLIQIQISIIIIFTVIIMTNTVDMQKNLKTHGIDILNIQCIPPYIINPITKECTTCKEINIQLFYNYNNNCIRNCSFGTIEDNENMACYDTCQEFNVTQRAYYIDVSSKKCVLNCNVDRYIHEEEKRCYEKCPKKYQVNLIYSNKHTKQCFSNARAIRNMQQYTSHSLDFPDITSITNYLYFIERAVDICNPLDPVFNNVCYHNDQLDYDLPQKYRFNMLFSKMEYVFTDNCIYEGYNKYTKKLILKCPAETQSIQFTLQPSTKSFQRDKIINIPLSCSKEIADISSNIGFWTGITLGLLGIVIFIIFIGFNWMAYRIDNLSYWLLNDQMKSDYFLNQNSIDYNKDELMHMKIGSKPSLCTILCNNIKICHPFITIFFPSVLNPLFFKYAIFIFNLFNQFGLNAVFYNEEMIEIKMTDANGNNFDYPMSAQFIKIVYTLLATMGLTMLIKLISLVSMQERNDLFVSIANSYSEDMKTGICKDFWKKGLWRRLIAYTIMCSILLFLFYYMVVFCGIYVITQYSWFYSGIWTIVLNWIVFAPFSIVMISLFENCNVVCVYYLKQIFWF